MSKTRAPKLFKPTPSLGKTSSNASDEQQQQPQPQQHREGDSELARALKQIFELRNSKLSNNNSNSSSSNSSKPEESVTLFGKKLSSSISISSSTNTTNKSLCRQTSDKLPAAATAHLIKELYKQHLKQKGTINPLTTFVEDNESHPKPELPLLNSLQEKRAFDETSSLPDSKRQRLDSISPATSLNEADIKLSICSTPTLIAQDQRCRDSIVGEKAAQLTVFYNGVVYVYDDIPAEKAKAIMVLAGSVSSNSSHFVRQNGVGGGGEDLSSVSEATKKINDEPADKNSVNDLPQARKASLQRFLEKRKDRLYSKASNNHQVVENSKKCSSLASSSPSLAPSTSCRSSVDVDMMDTNNSSEKQYTSANPTTMLLL